MRFGECEISWIDQGAISLDARPLFCIMWAVLFLFLEILLLQSVKPTDGLLDNSFSTNHFEYVDLKTLHICMKDGLHFPY